MAKGNEIIVSSGASPKGHFEECIVTGTPKPGTCMEIVPATAPVNGRFTMRARTAASGAKGPVCILLPDSLQGKLGVSASAAYSGGPKAPGDAYVTGTRGFVYWPADGEEFNMLVTNQTGTGDDIAIADRLGIEQTTGQLIKDNTYASAPFQALEAVTDPTGDFMLWVKYLGSFA